MTNEERGPEQQDAAQGGPAGTAEPREALARFHVSTDGDDERVVLMVEGEVDTFTSARLRDALNEALERGPTEIVLDLSNMELIDSTGLGVLVGALKKLRERDGVMVLRYPTPAVMRVLSIVGLTTYFTIEEAAPDAS
jgi:anti-sigma B factor antagonist